MGAFPSSAELDAINGNPETHPRIRTTSRLNVDTLKVSRAPGHAACRCWFCAGQPWACRKRLVHDLPASDTSKPVPLLVCQLNISLQAFFQSQHSLCWQCSPSWVSGSLYPTD